MKKMKAKFMVLVALLLSCSPALAGELWRHAQSSDEFDQYNQNAPVCDNICIWVRDLKRPDLPSQSCCGEGDRFEADYYERDGDEGYLVTITDGKGSIMNGTVYKVPQIKLKWDQGNPTKRGQIFISADHITILCFVPGFGF